MKYNVYVNEKFYKVYDTGLRTVYNPKEITDSIQRDIDNGLLNDYGVDKKLAILIEKVE